MQFFSTWLPQAETFFFLIPPPPLPPAQPEINRTPNFNKTLKCTVYIKDKRNSYCDFFTILLKSYRSLLR